MIDATFVEAPRQGNKREENAQIKVGETPPAWKEESTKAKLRRKDLDARWKKKNNEKHYGYKNHINADQEHKLVQDYKVTDASVHDSQIFEELLDHSSNEDGEKRAVYADSAYRSKEKEAQLAKDCIPSQVCGKGVRNNPLTEEQKIWNRKKSKVRVRVEHVFGSQAQQGGHTVNTIGILRVEVKNRYDELSLQQGEVGSIT